MSENAWSTDPLHHPTPDATVHRSAALTLDGYLERERERIAQGPTMAEWLREVRSLDWSGVRVEDLIADIREYRDRDES